MLEKVYKDLNLHKKVQDIKRSDQDAPSNQKFTCRYCEKEEILTVGELKWF